MRCRYKGERGPGASALAPPDPSRQQGTEGESQPPEPRTYEDGGRDPNPRTPCSQAQWASLLQLKAANLRKGLKGEPWCLGRPELVAGLTWLGTP